MQLKKLGRFSENIFGPATLIIFLTIINLLIYFDRGAIGAVLPKVKDHFNLSGTEEGAIASAFMVGYMIFSLIFAELATRIRPNFVMSFGLLMWSLSAALVGFSGVITRQKWGYYLLICSRALIGVGEASFLPIAPSILDDHISDRKKRTIVLSVFFTALPVGIAIGYGIGGILASLVTWESPFFSEAILMLLLAFITLFLPLQKRNKKNKKVDSADRNEDIDEEEVKEERVADDFLASQAPPPTFGDFEDAEADADDDDNEQQSKPLRESEKKKRNVKYNVFTALKSLLCNHLWFFAILGSTSYTFVIGALSFWAPSFIKNLLNIRLEYANLGFSVVSIFCGLFGTAFGGIFLDKVLGGSAGRKGTSKAFFCCFVFCLLSFPFGLAGLLTNQVIAFFLLLTAAEFFLFAITSPINCALLSCVPKSLRTFSMSFYIFLIHLFGDFPSPFLFGIFVDLSGSLQQSMIILWLCLIPCVLFYFVSWRVAQGRYERRASARHRELIEHQ